MDKREILKLKIPHFLGTLYRWGGDEEIRGFDCSGLTQELLSSVGLLDDETDRPAAGQLDYWKERDRFSETIPESTTMIAPPSLFGWLVFFKSNKSDKIIHIEMCLSNVISVGARGDSSVTGIDPKTKLYDRELHLKQAVAKKAYVKIRPIFDRKNMRFAGVANPW